MCVCVWITERFGECPLMNVLKLLRVVPTTSYAPTKTSLRIWSRSFPKTFMKHASPSPSPSPLRHLLMWMMKHGRYGAALSTRNMCSLLLNEALIQMRLSIRCGKHLCFPSPPEYVYPFRGAWLDVAADIWCSGGNRCCNWGPPLEKSPPKNAVCTPLKP